MQTKSARLEQHAKDAIAQYNKEVAGGGEPLFPDWALDLLLVLDMNDKLAACLKVARHAIANQLSVTPEAMTEFNTAITAAGAE